MRAALLLLALVSPALAGDVPDPELTPGIASMRTAEDLCAETFRTRDVRHVTAAMKRKVFARYGLKGNVPTDDCPRDKHGRVYEIDHSCSLEDGGENDILNLWPQCFSGTWNAVKKDRLETFLHRELCAGRIELAEMQRQLCLDGADWRKAWQQYFGQENKQ